MKVREHNLVQHRGTLLVKETIETSISIADMAQIQQMVTDLYSDTEYAVQREYATNAADSHAEAGVTDPIEIELPSSMRPTFVVRDRGLGLSHDELRDRFCQYGASSKRDSNEAVGMLGVGCKSGLTYASQFTIIAIKDGVKITGLMTKNDRNLGVLQILDTVFTTEHNGVEIQIPVSNVATFTKKARWFFSFWERGTVLVDGVEPECVFDRADSRQIDKDLVIVPRTSYGSQGGLESDFVVMGNVPYPCESRISTGPVNAHSYVTVTRVAIGEIDFTPSREALHYTPHTLATVKALNEILKAKIYPHAQALVDAKKTRWGGAKEAVRWMGILAGNRTVLTYKGESIPMTIPITGWSWEVNTYRRKAYKSDRIDLTTVMKDNVVLVRDHPGRSMDGTLKDNLQEKYPKLTRAIAICKDSVKPEHEDWLEGSAQEQYAEIRPRQKRRARQPGDPIVESFKWMVWKDHRLVETDTDLSPAAQFVYVLRSDPEPESGIALTRDRYRQRIGEIIDKMNAWAGYNLEFVVVRKPELEKFIKSHPEAKTFRQFTTGAVADIDAKLTEDQKAWGITPHDLKLFPADEILDAATASLVRRIQACLTPKALELHKHRAELKLSAYQTAHVGVPELTGKSDIKDRLNDWASSYPLFSSYRGAGSSQVPAYLEYMNATFLYRKQAANV